MTENKTRKIASFLRWRLVPVRSMERFSRLSAKTFRPLPKPVGKVGIEVDRLGLTVSPTIASADVNAMRDLFLPRVELSRKTSRNHPFVNLVRAEDLSADNLLMKYAFSKDVLDVAMDYFGGRVTLSGLQALYSFPEDDGPFVYLEKEASKKVGRSMIVRRIEDMQMFKESGGVETKRVYGKAGKSVLVDPAAVYHYGGRCKYPRLAIFATFNSDIPFDGSSSLISHNKTRIATLIKAMRPNLDGNAVGRMLML